MKNILKTIIKMIVILILTLIQKQISIPRSVDSFGKDVFIDCSSLEKMIVSFILNISNISLRNTKIKRIWLLKMTVSTIHDYY